MRFNIRFTRNSVLRPVLILFGATPKRSYVEIEQGSLRVCMGRWFDETFALESIQAFSMARWPWYFAIGGLGVKIVRDGVAVYGSIKNMVKIKLKEPRWIVVVFIPKRCSQIWISMEDPDGFLAALGRETGIAISEPE